MNERILKILGFIIAIPHFAFQMGWLVAGVWLAYEGAWSVIGWGLVMTFLGAIALSFAFLPGLIFILPATFLIQKGWKMAGYLLCIPAGIWSAFVMSLFYYKVIEEFLPYASKYNLIPLLLWSIGVATGCLSFMNNDEKRLGGESNFIFIIFSEWGFVASLISILLYKNDILTSLIYAILIVSIGTIATAIMNTKLRLNKGN
jgi:hypothetical protein